MKKTILILTTCLLLFASMLQAQDNIYMTAGRTKVLTWKHPGNWTGYTLLFVAENSAGERVINKTLSSSYASPYTTMTCTLYVSDTEDFTTDASYPYDVAAYGADTVQIKQGYLNMLSPVQTSFDGTNLPTDGTRITTVSLDNGTIQDEIAVWDTATDKWKPTGSVLSQAQKDTVGGMVRDSLATLNLGLDTSAVGAIVSDSLINYTKKTVFEDSLSDIRGDLITYTVNDSTGIASYVNSRVLQGSSTQLFPVWKNSTSAWITMGQDSLKQFSGYYDEVSPYRTSDSVIGFQYQFLMKEGYNTYYFNQLPTSLNGKTPPAFTYAPEVYSSAEVAFVNKDYVTFKSKGGWQSFTLINRKHIEDNVIKDGLRVHLDYRYVNGTTVYNLADDSATSATINGDLTVNDGFEFDSTVTKYIDFSNANAPTDLTYGTIEFKIKLNTILGSQFLIESSTSGSTTKYVGVSLENGRFHYTFRDGTAGATSDIYTDTLVAGQTYLLTIVSDGIGINFYINGILQEDLVYTVLSVPEFYKWWGDYTNTQTYKRIGHLQRTTASVPLNAHLYSVRWYDRVLSPEEIKYNYDNSIQPTNYVVSDTTISFPYNDLPNFYSAYSVYYAWTYPIYDKKTNTISYALQARDINNPSADSNFIYLANYRLNDNTFSFTKTYGNAQANTDQSYRGSYYDWNHYNPYLSKLGDKYLIHFGSHNTKSYYFTGDILMGTFGNKSVLGGAISYPMGSYAFNDTLWLMPRGTADNRMRTFYRWAGRNNALVDTLMDFTSYWAYINPPIFDTLSNGNKRACIMTMVKDPSWSVARPHLPGYFEVIQNGNEFEYYDKNHNRLYTIPMTEDVYRDSVMLYSSPDSLGVISWVQPIVEGDSIAIIFPEQTSGTTARIIIMRRLGTSADWDTLALSYDIDDIHKLKDWTYYDGNAYILWGNGGLTEANVDEMVSVDTLFMSKVTDLFQTTLDNGDISIIDTIYSDGAGDGNGVMFANFIRNGFIEETNYLGLIYNTRIGSTTAMNTIDSKLYYYFRRIQ